MLSSPADTTSSKFPVLVTGVAGFIGFHTAKMLLEKGHTVIGLDNINDYYDVNLKAARLKILEDFPQFHFHKVDLSNATAVKKIWDAYPQVLHIIHLAAQAGVRYSLENPYSYIESNVMGHLVMLELCRHREGFKHFVYASSSSVYGGNEEMPFSINHRTDRQISLYASTKKCGESMTESYTHLFGFAATGFRFFTVYGPWGRPDMAAFIFADAICAGKPLKLYNQGEMKRDFTYIDDITHGLYCALEHPPQASNKRPAHRVYNLGNNHTVRLRDYLGAIEDALGKKAIVELLPLQPGDVPASAANIDESRADLGFDPKTTIHEGIPAFIKWYKTYKGIDDTSSQKAQQA